MTINECMERICLKTQLKNIFSTLLEYTVVHGLSHSGAIRQQQHLVTPVTSAGSDLTILHHAPCHTVPRTSDHAVSFSKCL